MEISDKCKVTDTSLKIVSEVSYEEWEKIWGNVYHVARAYPFWVGDCLNEGERLFGEKYAQVFSENSSLSHTTMAHYKYVALRIPARDRRDSLSFGHHRLVLKEPPERRRELLQHAEEKGMNRDQFADWLNVHRDRKMEFFCAWCKEKHRDIPVRETYMVRICNRYKSGVTEWVKIQEEKLSDQEKSNSSGSSSTSIKLTEPSSE